MTLNGYCAVSGNMTTHRGEEEEMTKKEKKIKKKKKLRYY